MAGLMLFVFYLSHGLIWVCEIEIFQMDKDNGNPDLVCEKGHNYTLHSNPRHHQEEPQNTNSHKTPKRQLK